MKELKKIRVTEGKQGSEMLFKGTRKRQKTDKTKYFPSNKAKNNEREKRKMFPRYWFPGL